MSDFDVRVELCDLDGTLLVDLNDETLGYELVSSSMPEEEWRTIVTESPYVDGDFTTGAEALAAGRFEAVVRVSGSSWAQVESRREALRAFWIGRPGFLVSVYREGVAFTYRARRPNVSAPVATIDLMNNRRVVALSFPVQPNPTVTGI